MFVHMVRTSRTRLIAGAFAAAAVVVQLSTQSKFTDATPQVTAQPACLAWFGNKDDGHCMGYSNGSPVYVGTPEVGFFGDGIGIGIPIQTGPLLPGTTFQSGIG